MANTFNGIGTTYYGKKDIDFDGSFITTKWFVVGFFPIIPLSSCRLRDLGTSGIPFISRSTEYQVIEELPLNAIQVLFVYLYSFFIIAWTGYMLERKIPPFFQFSAIVIALAIPFIARMLFGQKTSAGSRKSPRGKR